MAHSIRPRVIDAWMQPAPPRFLKHEMFASVRGWVGLNTVPDVNPLGVTMSACEGLERAMAPARWCPDGPLITNDDSSSRRLFGSTTARDR